MWLNLPLLRFGKRGSSSLFKRRLRLLAQWGEDWVAGEVVVQRHGGRGGCRRGREWCLRMYGAQ